MLITTREASYVRILVQSRTMMFCKIITLMPVVTLEKLTIAMQTVRRLIHMVVWQLSKGILPLSCSEAGGWANGLAVKLRLVTTYLGLAGTLFDHIAFLIIVQ